MSRNILPRSLTATDLFFLGIGATLGTGSFLTSGALAAAFAGPAVTLSFLIAGLAAGLVAVCYSRLASQFGGCGGAYDYCRGAFGGCVAWLVGWELILTYGLEVVALARNWSHHFALGLGGTLERRLPAALLHSAVEGGLIDVPATAIIVVLACVLGVGLRATAKSMIALASLQLVTLAIFAGIALFNVNPEYGQPFLPSGWYGLSQRGTIEGVVGGATLVFIAYAGFAMVPAASDETKTLAADMLSTGMKRTLGVCASVFCLVFALLTLTVSYRDLDVPLPLAHTLKLFGFHDGLGMVILGGIAGLTAAILAYSYGLSRLVFALARDRRLPPWLSGVNPHTQTPIRATGFAAAVSAGFAGSVSSAAAEELAETGFLLIFLLVCLCAMRLPRIAGTVKPLGAAKPHVPMLPALGAMAVIGLLFAHPLRAWHWHASWLAIGLLIYHVVSRVANRQPDTTR